MTDNMKVICQHCGTELPLHHKGTCPKCGEAGGKKTEAQFSISLGIAAQRAAQKIRRYTKYDPYIIGIAIILVAVPFIVSHYFIQDKNIADLAALGFGILSFIVSFFIGAVIIEITHYNGHPGQSVVQESKIIVLMNKIQVIWKWLQDLFYLMLVIILMVAIAVYFFYYIGAVVRHETVDSPLAIAAVTIALGGFILLGAFYKERSDDCIENTISNKDISAGLKRIAKFLLISSILLLVISFLLPLLSNAALNASLQSTACDFDIIVMKAFAKAVQWTTGIFIGVSALTLSLGLVGLTRLLRNL